MNEDSVEWLRQAADTYDSALAKGGCYAPEPEWDFESIPPGLRGAADEIERLRAQNEALYASIAMIERAAAGAIYSQESIHAMALHALRHLRPTAKSEL
jgi:hypothetical protein